MNRRPNSTNEASRSAAKTVYRLCVALLIVTAAALLVRGALYVCCRYRIDHSEALFLHFIRRLSENRTIYPSLESYPYFMTPHLPLYYVLCSGLVRLFGLSYAVPRAVSLLSTIGIAGLIYDLARRTIRQAPYRVLAPLVFLSLLPVYEYAPRARPDMLGAFLSLAGFRLAIWGRGWKRWSAAACFALAVLTKQTLLAAPVSAYAYLAIRHRRRAVGPAALWLFLTTAAIGVTALATHGGVLQHAFALLSRTGLSLPLGAIRLKQVVLTPYPVFIGFALAAVAGEISERRWDPLTLYLTVATGSVTVACMHASTTAPGHYFMEFFALLSVKAAQGCARLFTRGHSGRQSGAVPLAAGLLLLAQLAGMFNVGYLPIRKRTPRQERLDYALASAYLAAHPGDVLATNPDILLFEGRDYLVSTEVMSVLARYGGWDQSPVVADIRRRRFALVAVDYALDRPETWDPRQEFCLSPEMREAIRDSYRFDVQVGKVRFYLPRDVHGPRGPSAGCGRHAPRSGGPEATGRRADKACRTGAHVPRGRRDPTKPLAPDRNLPDSMGCAPTC